MVFADIESRSLWTKAGAPLHLFKDIKDRECVIIPRAYDDGSLAGLQFNIGLYDKDRYIQSAEENGTAGLLIQLTHVRGNEHNTRYLAEGMWDNTVTPRKFYKTYSESILPGASGLLEEFCHIIDKADIYLGGRGQGNMPWNQVPLQIEILRKFRDHQTPFFSTPYGPEFPPLSRNGKRHIS